MPKIHTEYRNSVPVLAYIDPAYKQTIYHDTVPLNVYSHDREKKTQQFKLDSTLHQSQRIYITRRTDSNPRSSPNLSPSALYRKAGSAKCSILQEQAGRGWVSGLFVRRSLVAVRSTNIFFDQSPRSQSTETGKLCKVWGL